MTGEVRDAYDRWAATYDTMPNRTRDLDAEMLREEFEGQSLGDILELGCGTGKNTAWLVNHGRVVGLDFSTAMLERCRIAAPDAELKVADLTRTWPVGDQTIDTLVISLVLEHIEDLEPVAAEASRVLRTGGMVRVSELHPLRQAEGKRARFEDGGVLVEPPAFVHRREEYLRVFEEAGFVLESSSDARSMDDDASALPRLLVMLFSHRDS